MNYKEVLKELREERDLTQITIANYLGLDHTQYCHYENESRTIPLKHLNSLSIFYNVSIDYIFGFTSLKSYPNAKNEIDKSLVRLRLIELRKENRLTQKKLAEDLKISRTTITEYERGTNLIATPFIYTICKKYNISADYLLGKINTPKHITEKKVAILL